MSYLKIIYINNTNIITKNKINFKKKYFKNSYKMLY